MSYGECCTDIPVLVIFAPTASGKTALAEKLFGTNSKSPFAGKAEIVSADSMQVYKYMDIGSAKITSAEMDGIKHHLIDVFEPDEEFHVVKFQELAKQALQNRYIKLRETRDVIGVEICGSIKNVIALSAGMLDGLKANDSTKAMFLTEAMHDMEAILNAFGCNMRTVMSFAGLGDLLLTCTSTKSRNYS